LHHSDGGRVVHIKLPPRKKPYYSVPPSFKIRIKPIRAKHRKKPFLYAPLVVLLCLFVCLSVCLSTSFFLLFGPLLMILKYRSQQSAAGNPRNPNNSYGIPSRPNDANIPNFTFPKKNLMTILRDADMWQLETREKPTQDEEGEKKLTRRQSSVRTLDKAVQDDAGSGGGAFGQTLFIRCFTCSSGM
jgi:hypothetical protein